MGHVNNAVYLDWVDEAVEAIPDGPNHGTFVPRRYRLEYLLPVPPATAVVACAWPDDAGIAFRLADQAGHEYFRAHLEPGVIVPWQGDGRHRKVSG